MKLYYKAGACSLSPHILLREVGKPFEIESVDLKTHRTASGVDFYSINPKGYVPTLQLDNGEILTESVAIDLYIAQQYPEAKLAPPPDSLEYFRMIEWLMFISTELHKGFWPLFFDAGDKAKEVYRDKLLKRFAAASEELGNKPYVMGEHFMLPDAYFFTMLTWAESVNLDLSAYPNLNTYRQRVATRPAVQEALKIEAISSAKAA